MNKAFYPVSPEGATEVCVAAQAALEDYFHFLPGADAPGYIMSSLRDCSCPVIIFPVPKLRFRNELGNFWALNRDFCTFCTGRAALALGD
jgi:hypothetical protein